VPDDNERLAKLQVMDNLDAAILAFEVDVCWKTASRLRNILKSREASERVSELWEEMLRQKKKSAELWFQQEMEEQSNA
jgi:hypothetical protein